MTKDGGATWTDIVKNVGLPEPCYVATIEASRYEEGRAYVAFDGHRSDIDDPLVYVTEDLGKTWKPLRANLPRGSSRCLREDIKNGDLLYLGTEFGFWVSLDRGESWNSLNTNLPTVAVLDVAIHPTAGELVAATHGRSLWVLDVSPLRETTREVAKADVHLYKPTSAVRWRSAASHGGTNRRFEGQNPSAGAMIDYTLARKAAKLSLKIVDVNGATVSELRAAGEPGLHRVVWNLTRGAAQGAGPGLRGGVGGGQARGGGAGGGRGAAAAATGTGPRQAGTPATPGGSARAAGAAGAASGESESGEPVPQLRFARLQPVPPGSYRVVLTVDGKDFTQTVRVEPDPNAPYLELAADDDEEQDEDEEMLDEEGEEEEEKARSSVDR